MGLSSKCKAGVDIVFRRTSAFGLTAAKLSALRKTNKQTNKQC
jgi:hypothetical protein